MESLPLPDTEELPLSFPAGEDRGKNPWTWRKNNKITKLEQKRKNKLKDKANQKPLVSPEDSRKEERLKKVPKK